MVDVTTAVIRSSSSVEFTRVLSAGIGAYQEPVGPSACWQAGAFTPLADPEILGGGAVDPTLLHDVSPVNAFNLGEALFIRLTDKDQDVDSAVVNYAVVEVSHPTSGDIETVQLTETEIDSGVFVGYVASANGSPNSGDCVLQGSVDTNVSVDYTDPADAADSSQAAVILDPVSMVFESVTGNPIDGAVIQIVDAGTGLPAVVYGNDGVSVFPSSISSGGSEVDSSGTLYSFGPGEFRFPVVPQGNYQLVVTPPATYAAPSSIAISDLQLLPGGPFALGPASFGAAFTHATTLPVDFDIPVDPRAGALFLQKTTTTTFAAPGDFVRYELDLQNTAASGTSTNVNIGDALPSGVRFVSGSAQRDGLSIADPTISADLRSLQFALGDLVAGERAVIHYVVEIVSGKRNDELVNTATASADAGLVSNESNARIRLTEDLFRTTSTIIGRVVDGQCNSSTFTDDQGVSGVRVYLEDGRFAVSDESGRFHLEGLRPGTHVAQIDPESVPNYFEIVGCDSAPQFAGRKDSQFVKSQPGSLTRADFYLRRKLPPKGLVDIEMKSLGTDSTEEVAYSVTLSGEGNIRIRNAEVMVLLPEGVAYLDGTLQVDGKRVADPRVVGPSLTINLPEQFGEWTRNVSFEARISNDVHGELTTKAFAKFDSPIEAAQQTPIVETKMVREQAVVENAGYVLNLKFGVLSAQLSNADRLSLDELVEDWNGVGDINIAAIGHSDSQGISPANQAVFADNYVLSRARALSAANYLAKALDVDSRNVTVQGRGPDDSIASNATAEGRQLNRRVELILSGKRPTKPSFLEVTQATSGIVIAATQGAVPGAEEELLRQSLSDAFDDDTGLPSSQVEPAMAEMQAGTEILLPESGFNPAIPSTKISVKHGLQHKLDITINGSTVSPLTYDGVEVNDSQTFAVSRWKGVELADGPNNISVTVRNLNGDIETVLERVIDFAGTAVRGEIVPDMSVLVADGKTRPVIAVRLFDRSGKEARQGAIGTFRVNTPYRSWWEVEYDRRNKIVAVGSREPLYRVGPGGIALIELEPTTQAGDAKITLNFDNRRQQELHTWLSATPRDWILVGFAEGQLGYNTLADNMTAATAAGFDDGYYDEGRIAFFAKGQVKGEYLLTAAYDSDRERSANRSQFQTVINPDAYYPLYADRSDQRFDAASQRKLYLKLERRQFFALFGDYDTGMSVTDLARYERRFNGLKSGYRGQNVGYTVFATETNQSFVRDEIRGDGTSGLYQLSRAPIIANSEQVRIEVRDRFDTGEIISSTTLSRFLDYNLDTLDGSLYFKQPVPGRDQAFNPIFIVVEYESESNANEDIIAGGRASLRTADDNLEVGASHINEGQQGAEADLTGFDLRWQINTATLLKAEVATSNRLENGVDISGDATSLELEHQGEKLDMIAYVKEIDDGFGLGQQNAAEKGIRKVGLDGRAQLTERFYFDGAASWQQNLLTEAIRNTARAQLRFEDNGFTVSTGIVHAADEFSDGETSTSDIAEIALSKKVGKFTLRGTGSFELSDTAQNVDFPTTMVFGADYRIRQGVELFAEHEEASGPLLETSMTRLGVKAAPWNRAQINSSVTTESTEFGPRLFSNVGLIQGFELSDHWTLDVGVDQANTISDSTIRQFDPDRELVSGSFTDDYTAVFVGAGYAADLWSASSRVEYRNSDTEKRRSLLSGWYREPALGHGLSAGLNVFTSDLETGAQTSAANFKFGWAWRKSESRWSLLNRIDLILEDTDLLLQREESRRLINNLNANRRISSRTQLSLQYAFKYVKTMFDSQEFSGFTDLIGLDFRRGFKSRWDWGAHASVYHSYESKVFDYGLGLDVGFNIRDNMWVSVGYNVAGFHDSDFTAARYTAQGPYLQISVKADQHALRKIAGQRQ
ncbi:MAG: OmpA family protein [Woeseiaceae bacterium]